MPALQIRECPDDLYRCIKGSAEANHRSIARETTALLESCFNLDANAAQMRKRAAAVESLGKLGPLPVPEDCPSVHEILHAEYEGRAESCLS